MRRRCEEEWSQARGGAEDLCPEVEVSRGPERPPLTQTFNVANKLRHEVFGDVGPPGAFAMPRRIVATLTQEEKLIPGDGSIPSAPGEWSGLQCELLSRPVAFA